MNADGKYLGFEARREWWSRPRHSEDSGRNERSDGIVTPWLPQLTPKPVIGIAVVEKLLGLGIPLPLSAKAER